MAKRTKVVFEVLWLFKFSQLVYIKCGRGVGKGVLNFYRLLGGTRKIVIVDIIHIKLLNREINIFRTKWK